MNHYSHRIAVGKRFSERIANGDAAFLNGIKAVKALPCTVMDGEARTLSGINLFIVMQVMKDQGWVDPRFFTVEHIESAGWSLAPDVKKIGLQFLTSTGVDGVPLEKPVTVRFQVANASQILGVPEYQIDPLARTEDIEKAVSDAGYLVWVEGLNAALNNWMWDLQSADIHNGRVSAADALLRSRMAKTLLEMQTDFDSDGNDGIFTASKDSWVQSINDEPLSFSRAACAAEKLAAEVMKEVRSLAQIRASEEAMRAAKTAPALPGENIEGTHSTEGDTVKRNAFLSAKVEAMFLERQAVLAVPFAEKDRAKELGAVWYGPLKLWFVPKGMAIDIFKEWNPSVYSLGVVATRSMLLDSFMDAMASLGLDTSAEIKDDGKWHYVAVDTSMKKNLAGAYILSLDGGRNGEAIGTILNRHTGEEFTWKHEGQLLTPEQRARMRAEVLQREAVAAEELVAGQNVAAIHAQEIWDAGEAADGHGYVVMKGIDAGGLRQVPGSVLLKYAGFHSESGTSIIREHDSYLIVPMTNSDGVIRAVQAISKDGVVKSFMRGAQKKGTMTILGAASVSALGDTDIRAIAYVEGFATGASLHAASQMPVVVCFDAGNLETVVADTVGKLPQGMERILAVDNDQFYVERSIGFLSEKLGVNPHAEGGQVVPVVSGSKELRSVPLGEVVADGTWHQVAKGSYCVSLAHESDNGGVCSVIVELVPNDGRKIRSSFANRGVDAGKTALNFIEKAGCSGTIVTPEFQSLLGRPTDWNDLHKREGVEAIRGVLRKVEGVVLPREKLVPVKAQARSVDVEIAR